MANLSNIDTGLAGEYYVAAMMHLHGWNASLTLKNYPSVDIFGYNPTNQKKADIQVKTGANKYTVLLGWTNQNYNPSKVVGPFVFVHILPDCTWESFIVPASDVVNMVNNVCKQYSGPAIRPIRLKWSQLSGYKDKWNNLW